MADSLVFEESINTEISSHDFVDKKYLYVNDNNNGSYSSQVIIDTTSLSNCGSYVNWSEAFLAIPLVLQMESSDVVNPITATNALDFAMGLKNGFWQIIHSMSVELNNGSVIQQTPFLNVFASFKNLTSWSLDDLNLHGALCGFFPDSSKTWLYNTTAVPANSITNFLNTSGQGYCNNRNAPVTTISTLTSWTGTFVVANSSTAVTAITTTQGQLQLGMYIVAPGLTGTYVSAIVYGADGRTPQTATLSAATGAAGALTATIPLIGMSPETNVNFVTTSTTNSDNIRSLFNAGFQTRQSWLNYSPSVTTDTPTLANSLSSNQGVLQVGVASNGGGGVSGGGAYGQIFMSYVQRQAGSRAIIFDAVVRLKDIADFFQKTPLLKGASMRLYINTNQAYFTCGVAPAQYSGTAVNTGVTFSQIATGCLALTSSPVILGGGNTNPIMVASMDAGQGSANLYLPTYRADQTQITPPTIRYGLSIVRTQFSQFTNQLSAPVTSVRLYAPAYDMSPLSEQRYLNLSPTKKIVYNDIFYYTFPNISGGSTFSFLVTNGLPNIRSVLCVPTLPKASNGTPVAYPTSTVLNGVTTNTLLSPFSTTGGTPDPISITQFQIQISGKNLFLTNLLYDYEVFAQQFSQSNSINGGLTTSLSSGLIGFDDWTSTYRYYYGNASRSIPSEDGVAKAVQVSGLNQSSVTIDMIVFVEFQREITVDVRSGARVA